MYFDKYKDVTYNGIFLSEVCEIQDIKIPFLSSREIEKLDIASIDGERYNGFKTNSYKIEIEILIDCDTEFEYNQKINELRSIFDVEGLKEFSLGNGKFILAMIEDQIDAPEKLGLYSCELVINLYCPVPYFFSKETKMFQSENGIINITNNGNRPVPPFISIGFSKDTYFCQLELESTGEKILIGKYPILGIPVKAATTEVLYEDCKTMTNWVQSSATINPDRSIDGTMAITDEGEGIRLSTLGNTTTKWRGALYRINLEETLQEFKVEAFFTHKSTGINGDPTVKNTDTQTIISGNKTTYYKVTVSSLNVRSGPSTKYKKLGALQKGYKIYNGIKSNGWVSFTYNGKTGYCSADYLTLVVEDSTVTTTTKNMVTKMNTPLRSGPSMTSQIIKTVGTGKVLRVITSKEYTDVDSQGITRYYYKLDKEFDGIMGYVCKANLVEAGNVTFSYDEKETEVTADDKTGTIELYLFSTNGVKIGKLELSDQSEYFEYTSPKVYVGEKCILEDDKTLPEPKKEYKVTENDGKTSISISNYLSGAWGDWNDFFGKLSIKREKINNEFVWSAEVIKINDGNIIKTKSVNSIKSNSFPDEGLGYICLYIGTMADSMEKCSDMSMKWLKVDSINPISDEDENDITYFKEGDILDVDLENHCAYLNHQSCDNLVDIGSRFFMCKNGEEKIKVISNDKDTVASAVIREKWIGGI